MVFKNYMIKIYSKEVLRSIYFIALSLYFKSVPYILIKLL